MERVSMKRCCTSQMAISPAAPSDHRLVTTLTTARCWIPSRPEHIAHHRTFFLREQLRQIARMTDWRLFHQWLTCRQRAKRQSAKPEYLSALLVESLTRTSVKVIPDA